MTQSKIVTGGFCVLALAGCVGWGVLANHISEGYTIASKHYKSELAKVNKEIGSQKNENKLIQSMIKDKTKTSADIGEQVANAQTTLTSVDPSGDPSVWQEALGVTSSAFTEGDGYKPWVKMHDKSGFWQYESVYAFGDIEVPRGVWSYFENGSNLRAIATADYHNDSQTFTNLQIVWVDSSFVSTQNKEEEVKAYDAWVSKYANVRVESESKKEFKDDKKEKASEESKEKASEDNTKESTEKQEDKDNE